MNPHGVSPFTAEQKERQEARYAQNHEYDYVFIGAGNAALSTAALLAKAGERVCIIEAYDRAGGYVHTFSQGEYSWCAQVQYVWGAQSGGKIYQFLKKLGLEKELTFEPHAAESYDIMAMPDGKKVPFPYGFDNLANSVDAAYPGHRKAIDAFISTIITVRDAFEGFPPKKSPLIDYIKAIPKLLTVVKYHRYTLQDVFDLSGLPPKLQTVFAANAGDYGLPPTDIAIIPYVSLMAGYDRGAYYPTQHFKGYIERIVQLIESHGGHFYYKTRVSKVHVKNKTVTHIDTADGKTFTARKGFICNMDPQAAANELIGIDQFPWWYRKRLVYPYSPSGTIVYLGLQNIDLREYGFGDWNFWHFPEWDVNHVWNQQEAGDLSNPWFFVSTHSLHSSLPGVAPVGGSTMEITTNTNYDELKTLKEENPEAYAQRVDDIAETLIDQVEKYYIPNIRNYIVEKVVSSPLTNEYNMMAPQGNAYGAALIPAMMKLSRPHIKTPFKNFYWCNATVSGAGVSSTAQLGMKLYAELTGDTRDVL